LRIKVSFSSTKKTCAARNFVPKKYLKQPRNNPGDESSLESLQLCPLAQLEQVDRNMVCGSKPKGIIYLITKMFLGLFEE